MVQGFRYMAAALALGVVLSFSNTLRADEPDLLQEALDLVHKAESTKGDAAGNVQRADLLTQAMKLTQQAPNHRLKGHRVAAVQALRGAISELRDNDPNQKAASFIYSADKELSAAVALGGSNEAAPAAASSSAPVPEPKEAPILEAAKAGDLATVKALVTADPTMVSLKGVAWNTPLLYAAGKGHIDVVEYLLANKADVNAKNEFGYTALIMAADRGDKPLAELLIANKIDVNVADTFGKTALHHLTSNAAMTQAEQDRNQEMAQLLITAGADVNARDRSGLTPLFYAAMMNHPATAELLLENKADVNAAGNPDSVWAGDTALYISACNGAADVAKLLIAHGADLNAKGKDGLTPLQIAVKNHHDAPPVSSNDVAGPLRAAGVK